MQGSGFVSICVTPIETGTETSTTPTCRPPKAATAVPTIGTGETFTGLIDLIEMKAITYSACIGPVNHLFTVGSEANAGPLLEELTILIGQCG